jgi:Holliday junction resolvase RusA-like endonuclease
MAYRGRRFSTPTLKAFHASVSLLAPKMTIPTGKLKVVYTFGVSSKASDVDNLVKTTQDALANKYGFNDKMIYKIEVEKVDVAKGNEYIDFTIHSFLD